MLKACLFGVMSVAAACDGGSSRPGPGATTDVHDMVHALGSGSIDVQALQAGMLANANGGSGSDVVARGLRALADPGMKNASIDMAVGMGGRRLTDAERATFDRLNAMTGSLDAVLSATPVDCGSIGREITTQMIAASQDLAAYRAMRDSADLTMVLPVELMGSAVQRFTTKLLARAGQCHADKAFSTAMRDADPLF